MDEAIQIKQPSYKDRVGGDMQLHSQYRCHKIDTEQEIKKSGY